ncbi:uncharacterized protein Z518_02171 [Rhinocladiella mackenziei CBS 650.93]|uniref:Uncharacterized protein n=1 Tax=Rhinocladiella mackenziei CBS 650.93 TaxID=1442369 RepID=A0A0D2HAR6_9EURO|nr:uncharacterized protein Z518_02171 [Rhinocladiella mackenziei CBS 650.93]KIX07518.1 hypothetical protein Z518_02171 [Rhinocladiella mackenziei CBS 650.93]
MNHASKDNEGSPLDHDPTSKLPSKSSQPPLTMSSPSKLDTGWNSTDTRIYYAKKYRQILSSAPACALAVVAGAPLENIKVRMQSRHFQNAFQATKYTYRTEGLRGFWAGTFNPLVSITTSRALGFSIYRKAKYTLDGWIEAATGRSPLQHVNKPGTYPDIYTLTCFTGAGMVSGGVTAVALTPVELIKNATQTSVLMASQGNITTIDPMTHKNAGRVSSWASMRRIVERRGPLGLWTGFRLHLLRDVIGSGIYFGVYETTKQSLNSYYGAEKANSAGAVAMAGAICGVGAWVVTYPLDTMKTRAQNNLVGSDYTTTASTVASKPSAALSSALDTAAKAAALSSKWKGVEMIILRSSIQNMIQMSFFEQAKVVIDNLTFSDGSRTLPEVERHFGRDSKVHKNDKL